MRPYAVVDPASDPEGGFTSEPEATGSTLGVLESSLTALNCGSHSICNTSSQPASPCTACERMICDADPYCCDTAWDDVCVRQISSVCGVEPITGNTLIDSVSLTVFVGGDDVRAGSQVYGSFRMTNGTALASTSLNRGESWRSSSARALTLPLGARRRLRDLAAFVLQWDGAPRRFPDSYDNCDINTLRVHALLPERCPVEIASLRSERMTGETTQVTARVTIPR